MSNPSRSAASISISISEVPLEEHGAYLTQAELDTGNYHRPRELLSKNFDELERPHVNDMVRFEQSKPPHLRIFRAVDKNHPRVIATAFLHPIFIDGLVLPKFATAARNARISIPPSTVLKSYGWMDLRVIRSDARRKGVGTTFARKLLTSEKFALRKQYKWLIGAIDIQDPVAVAFLGTLKGRGIFTVGGICYARFEVPRPDKSRRPERV